MSIVSSAKAKLAASKLAEERLYALAHDELESGEVRKGLWAKALAESDGDKARAEGRYLKLRVEVMKSEASVEAHQAKQASTTPKVRRTPWGVVKALVGRHWAGTLPLWVSFWVASQFFGLIFSITYLSINDIFWDAPASGFFGVRFYAAICSLLALFSVPFVVWQCTGVWRSASRYVAEGRRRFFPYFAKFLIVLSVPTFFTSVYISTNSVGDYLKLALNGPDTSGMNLSRMPNPWEKKYFWVSISGPIEFGDVAKVREFLSTLPKGKIYQVSLDSSGGNLEVAYRISRLLERFGVETTVSDSGQCESACTVLFLAGQVRDARGEAPLGFHSATHMSGNDGLRDLANSQLRKYYLDKGMKAACVDNAINTPANEMWYPDVGTRANCGISESSLSDLDVISEDGRSQQPDYGWFFDGIGSSEPANTQDGD